MSPIRLLVTGASGYLGGYLLRELASRPITVTAWSGSCSGDLLGFPLRPVDLADADAVADAFREARPEVVLHAGAMAAVGDCFRDPARARCVNVDGTALLTRLASEAKARVVFVSTDLVFNGERGRYCEDDALAPVSVYGRTKLEAEQAVRAGPGNAVVRVSLLFGPGVGGRESFFDQQVAALRAGRAVTLFTDEWRTPLALPVAARALVDVALADFAGLLHVGGPERLSRLEMGQRLVKFLGRDASCLRAATRATAPAGEPRPRDTSLDSSRWRRLFPEQPWPTFDEALRAMLSR